MSDLHMTKHYGRPKTKGYNKRENGETKIKREKN